LALSFLFAGCATVGSKRNSELAVGIVVFTGTKYPSYESGRVTLNGTHTKNISITLINLETEKKYTLKSSEKGLFYAKGLPAGIYLVSRLRIELAGEHIKIADTWNSSQTGEPLFEITAGKVNNMGQILWKSEYNSGADVRLSAQHAAVRTEFRRAFSNSEFNRKTWVNCISFWRRFTTRRAGKSVGG
jgi:hypothetical protein